MHAMFELVSAIQSDKRSKGAALNLGEFGKKLPFRFDLISIDYDFFNHYLLDPLSQDQLIGLKAGDMIFVSLASGKKATLISEDERMIKVARSVGVRAVTTDEYLETGG